MSVTSRPSVRLAVVGAGPCGLAVGAAARKAGLSCVLLDRGPLCASLVEYPPYLSFFSTSDKLELEGVPFPSARPNPTRHEALAYYRGIARYFEIDVRQHRTVASIRSVESGFELDVRTPAGREEPLHAQAVVIATGGFHAPNALGVPGEDLPKVSHEYREAHPYWDQDVLVVGGGNSAVEASLELFRVGARVRLVHFAETLDPGVKPWLLPDIRNRFAAGEVTVHWRHRVAEVRPESVLLREEGSGATLEVVNDWVLALTGWAPDPRLLRSVGVPIDPETGVPAHDPATMETPVPGVFIAGVLAAGFDANRIFIENGRAHGRLIVERLRGAGGSSS